MQDPLTQWLILELEQLLTDVVKFHFVHLLKPIHISYSWND